MPEEYGIGSLNEQTGDMNDWIDIPKDMFAKIEKIYTILSKTYNNINEKSKFGIYKLVETTEGSVIEYSHKISEKFYNQLKYKIEHGKPMPILKKRTLTPSSKKI